MIVSFVLDVDIQRHITHSDPSVAQGPLASNAVKLRSCSDYKPVNGQ